MHKKSAYFFAWLSLIILASCAQMVAPTGGDKDNTAPEVLQFSPKNKTTNFTKSKIDITFNEYIQLTKTDEQIIISPPLNTKPDFTNKGKVLEIKFKETLLPNTTYTINFGNAIGDNKENNTLPLSYVFSTGSSIDSNFISGEVLNAFTNQPEKDITIGLYDVSNYTDSTAYKYKPVYLGKTNINGVFTITNLPNTSFYLLAFNDVNKNLKYDKTEAISFLNNTVNTTDTVLKKLTLKLFKPETYPIGSIVDTFCKELNKFSFVTYKPNGLNITSTYGKQYTKTINTGTGLDTIYVFTKTADSVARFTTSTQNKTTQITIKNTPAFKAPKLYMQVTKQIEINDSIKLRFNNPITSIDTSRIKLFKDSTQIKYNWIKTSDFEYAVAYNWEEKTSYKIQVSDSACKDFYNQYNKKDGSAFTIKALKEYANLLLHITIPPLSKHQYLLQLLSDDDKKVCYEFIITKNQDINLINILPGTYKIKYIYDINGNNSWDNGDFNQKQQPEQVGYFKEKLVIKPYWDLEQSILIE